ncbi:putative pilS cassette [Neisseria meningitidis 96060]|nr:putative pilS cassette [Neisseria meningitidis 96060]
MISDKFSSRLISVLSDKCLQSKISSFPRRRESRSVGTETYRVKRFCQP